MDPRRRGVLQHEPLPGAAALHAAGRRVRHLQARVRRRVPRRRRLPAHHASARHRLPLAHLDPAGADRLHPGARESLVRDARGYRPVRKGARRLIDNFSSTQVVRKRVTPTRGGVVAAQHKRAAEVGAAILEASGDAIDAAVATSFALGVVEPWMSGISAGGCMVLWRTAEQKAYAIDYGMRSPAALDPAAFPLSGEGRASDLFAWPRVKDDRNVQGATAVAVPGVVAGMALAHERFGKLPWRQLVAPAVRLAEEGMILDWFAGLQIASTAQPLSLDPDAAAMFLEEGKWPPLAGWTALAEKRIDQRRLSSTLNEISEAGAKALYGGDIGAAMAKDVRDKGGSLSLADLASYRAGIADPLETPYRGGRVLAASSLFTGGPAIAACLRKLSEMA